jgi:hypothetical protein
MPRILSDILEEGELWEVCIENLEAKRARRTVYITTFGNSDLEDLTAINQILSERLSFSYHLISITRLSIDHDAYINFLGLSESDS